MVVARYRLNVDYTSATQGSDDGHVVFTPNVNITGGSGLGTNATIVSPLGTNTIAASVSVTPATSSSWSITSTLLPASLGRKSSAASLAVVQAGLTYETVAASATDQVLGGSGAAGDFLSHIGIEPATTGAGTVVVKDGATTIFTFTTGTLADLSPKTVPFGAFSVSGGWSVTTGSNVAVIGFGTFT